jgi:predicted DNA-binding protein (MmcQ/YjbR family)
MDADAFREALLALPGAAFDVKWGDDRTYCVGGTIFATAGRLGELHPLYGFKASEMAFELLCEQEIAKPMPYMGRNKWVLVQPDGLPAAELLRYAEQSYETIAAKLTKRVRADLGRAT